MSDDGLDESIQVKTNPVKVEDGRIDESIQVKTNPVRSEGVLGKNPGPEKSLLMVFGLVY